MQIGIVSDTHGHVPFTLEAVRLLEAFAVDRVIHCGDIGSPEIPALFQAWPTDFVFGNVDTEERELGEAVARTAGHTCHGRFGELELAGCRVAFLHGDDTRLLRTSVRDGGWDLVCYGHTHQAAWEQIGTTRVLNPGAVFRARPRSITLLSLPDFERVLLPLE